MCLLQLAPVFVEVLEELRAEQEAKEQQAKEQQQQQQAAAKEGAEEGAQAGPAAAAGAAAGASSAESADAGGEDEAAAAAAAEAVGLGVGCWRLPPLDLAAAVSAVQGLAATLLLLRLELPRCLLSCPEAVTAVMGLLGKVAARCNVRHVSRAGRAGGERDGWWRS